MSVSRRLFLVAVPVTGAVVAFGTFRRGPQSPYGSEAEWAAARGGAGGSVAADGSNTLGEPVVSFHLDRPYLDLTGLEEPYVPPAGMRSGASLAAMSEEEIFSRLYGFI
jgi:hypothetical protein